MQEVERLLNAYQSGDYQAAAAMAQAMTQRFPAFQFGWKAYGSILKLNHQLQDCIAPMQEAVRLAPQDAESQANLGDALASLGHYAQSADACRLAVLLAPGYALAHNNLGNALFHLGEREQALACYLEAIRLEPAYAQAHFNLGNLLDKQGLLSEAERAYRQALRLNDAYPQALTNLSAVLASMGRHAEAEAACRQAIAIEPLNAQARSNLIFVMSYLESASPQALLDEARAYGQCVSTQVTNRFEHWSTADRPARLKIGFVSGDFRNHPVGYFLEGLMSHLDRDRFETYAFTTNLRVDALTEKFRDLFAHWCPIHGLNDDEAARLIHDQAPHVLVDLAGHTALNRLAVFARRPAPVQVTWLGYFGTTGLTEMDWILASPHAVPESEAWHYTERVWRLPETSLCFTAPSVPLPVGPLPAAATGHITFGCFNNLAKVNARVVRVWARVLQAIPGSVLMLKARQLSEPDVAERMLTAFEEQGVERERLVLQGPSSREDYLAAYHQIDIALDPFPYTGGTTSVEGLCMGVPVLTLKGDRFIAHQGEVLAHNAGLSDWIARDEDDYVRRAARFAGDLPKLAMLRATLRESLLRSPLCDAPRFATHFGEAMQSLWTRHLQRSAH